MSRLKGSPKTGGRKKGVPNKFTIEVRDMVKAALEGVGGVAYLEQQARDSPAAFLSLVARLIPREIEANLTHHRGLFDDVPAVEAQRIQEKLLELERSVVVETSLPSSTSRTAG